MLPAMIWRAPSFSREISNLDASERQIAQVISRTRFHETVPTARVATTPPRHLFDGGRHIDWAIVRGQSQPTAGKVLRSSTPLITIPSPSSCSSALHSGGLRPQISSPFGGKAVSPRSFSNCFSRVAGSHAPLSSRATRLFTPRDPVDCSRCALTLARC